MLFLNVVTQFFIIHDYKYPLYGISCYEQIKSFRDDTEEIEYILD